MDDAAPIDSKSPPLGQAELDILTRRGVQTLIIEKADTFLQALVAAVRAQKLKA
jgi:hypothetical protein